MCKIAFTGYFYLMELSVKTIDCRGFIISRHCQKRMDIREILLDEIIETINYGELITKYEEDKPFPSNLILKFVNGRPLHVMVAQDPVSLQRILITAYWPDYNTWQPDFRNKKNG